jgi:hypothetical protein
LAAQIDVDLKVKDRGPHGLREIMQILLILLFVTGTGVLVRAWLATRATALFHAVHWSMAAWLTWGLAIFAPERAAHPNPVTYVALCLTGCAGVAVLGARRPHVTAWNFVVLGLLAVMALPLIERSLIGSHSLDWLRITFLAVTLGVGVSNYLPTRFGAAALLAGIACAAELIVVAAPEPLPHGPESDVIQICLLAAPAFAWVRLFPTATNELDREWRVFRDAWGFVWGERVREQFNRSAANAAWPVKLTWFGFRYTRPIDATTQAALGDTLRALLLRFTEVEKK